MIRFNARTASRGDVNNKVSETDITNNLVACGESATFTHHWEYVKI